MSGVKFIFDEAIYDWALAYALVSNEHNFELNRMLFVSSITQLLIHFSAHVFEMNYNKSSGLYFLFLKHICRSITSPNTKISQTDSKGLLAFLSSLSLQKWFLRGWFPEPNLTILARIKPSRTSHIVPNMTRNKLSQEFTHSRLKRSHNSNPPPSLANWSICEKIDAIEQWAAKKYRSTERR